MPSIPRQAGGFDAPGIDRDNVLHRRSPLPIPTPAQTIPTPVLLERQAPVQTSTIPSFYGALTSSPDPGAVAGITLGAVAGFCLVLYMIYFCINIGNNDSFTEGSASVVTRKSYRSRSEATSALPPRRHSHRHSRGDREARVEITRTTSTHGPEVVMEEVDGRRERIIREERRRSVSRGGPPPMMRVVGSSVGSSGRDDEVVVIEENSPSPRERERRRSRIRSVERRSSGYYREVDPDRFAGGDADVIEVRRSSSRRG
ncbi:hypothetical protein QBC38DRAFT_476670 [Podospora fimiseda]|uniref:Transmembrane protein n=1 Tax=Podospora fimiseda TaxID=252190 RepID=A0AAN7BQW2_9PEZI|nr:hypothetical protein QBC38DRAFT_476670 [Podospora fimiseda]